MREGKGNERRERRKQWGMWGMTWLYSTVNGIARPYECIVKEKSGWVEVAKALMCRPDISEKE